jgi:hypothetical protein
MNVYSLLYFLFLLIVIEDSIASHLTRKRETALPASSLANESYDKQYEATELSEEEKLFIRYLEEDSSHSLSFSMASPSSTPTIRVPTSSPSVRPTSRPSSKPSSKPSSSPSRSPTLKPTKQPVGSPVSSPDCVDSTAQFQKLAEEKSSTTPGGSLYKLVDCAWVGKKVEVRCTDKAKSHCPATCNSCNDSLRALKDEDSSATFYSPDTKEKTCKFVQKNPEKRCKKNNMDTIYCPQSCGDSSAQDTIGSFFALPQNPCKFVSKKLDERCTFKVAKKFCPSTCGFPCQEGMPCTDVEKGAKFPLPHERYTCVEFKALTEKKKIKLCKKDWMKTTCRQTCAQLAQ